MTLAVALVALASSAALTIGQAGTPRQDAAPQARSADSTAEAYQLFLQARHFEAADEVDQAIEAYRQAMALDPGASAIPAELGALFMRLDRPREAIAAAEQALKVDAGAHDAHRVLGLVYAGLVERGRGRPRTGQPEDESAARAIFHLEQAMAGATSLTDPNVRVALSRLYVRTGAFDKAIPLLTDLVSEEPDWYEGPALLARAYSGAGREADGVRWLEQAARSDPRLNAQLADFYERQRRWKDAADAYSRALEVSPRNPDLKTRGASALINAGGRDNAARAAGLLTEVLAVRPNDLRVLYLLSQAERIQGNAAAAEEAARRIIAANARSPWGYYALAELFEERHDHQAIVDALVPAVAEFRSRAVGDAGELVLLLPHLGLAYQELGQYDKAIAAFDEAYRVVPGDGTVAAYLVGANLAAKRFAAAADLAHSARAANPDDVRLAGLEAQALRGSGRAADGLAVLETFVSERPDNPVARIALAQFYASIDRSPQAISTLQDAAAKFPDNTAIRFELGAVFEKMKRFGDAEAQFLQILAREPDHAPALNFLGYMLAERGERLEESVEYLKKALQVAPENGSYLDSLGWAYYKSDKLDLAEQHLRRAAEQLVTVSVVQSHYGDVLFRLKRYDDAIAAWTRALDGDGEDVDPKDLQAKIRNAREQLTRK